jgi:hypothetical protein
MLHLRQEAAQRGSASQRGDEAERGEEREDGRAVHVGRPHPVNGCPAPVKRERKGEHDNAHLFAAEVTPE